MCHEQVEISIFVEVRGLYAHASLGRAVEIHGATVGDRHLLEHQVTQIPPHLVGRPIVGNIDILAPVVVEIGNNDAESVTVGSSKSRALGDVREGSIGVVLVEKIRCRSLVVVGRAVVFTEPAATGQFLVGAPQQIAADEQLRESIPVEISKRSRSGKARISQSGGCCTIFKCAITSIDVENILADIADEDIDVSVTVDVATTGSHAKSLIANSRLIGHIGEVELAIISKQSVPGRIGAVPCEGSPGLDAVDVQITISIIIEQGDSSRDRFRNPVAPLRAE